MAKKQKLDEKVEHKVGVIIESGEKLLLLKKKNENFWVVPNNDIDLKDIVKINAVKVLKEDVGCEIELDELKFGSKFEWDMKSNYLIFYFFKLEVSFDFKINFNSEKYSECKWVSFKDAYESKDIMPFFPNVLEKIYYEKIK
jgi:ADP-ribose pyrophosphatase YjhB (NUDIX family)